MAAMAASGVEETALPPQGEDSLAEQHLDHVMVRPWTLTGHIHFHLPSERRD